MLHAIQKIERAPVEFRDKPPTAQTRPRRSRIERFDLQLLIHAGLQTMRATQQEILGELRDDVYGVLEPIRIGSRNKPALAIDLIAERNAARRLRRSLKCYDPVILGEESLRDDALDLTQERRLVVMLDMIDGTDLLARGLGNWCSAMVFWCPAERRILAAFVAMPGDGVYFATERHPTMKCRYRGTPHLLPVRGPSGVKRIADSAIAFYGQKVANFAAVAGRQQLLGRLMQLKERCEQSGQPFNTRIYNLGGNPAMTHLLDGPSRLDAVFELHGQAPHDFVPGAYLAVRSGANLNDLDGNPIDLAVALERPTGVASRARYLLTSTEQLSQELRACLIGEALAVASA
jgi:fructose-1,6-bisphosphatase/inositol monophosphatase family enzyme